MKKELLLILLSAFLLSGCGVGSESVEDKMLRMAKAKAAAKKRQADEDEDETIPAAIKTEDKGDEATSSTAQTNVEPTGEANTALADSKKTQTKPRPVLSPDDDDYDEDLSRRRAATAETSTIPEEAFALSSDGKLAAHTVSDDTVEVYNSLLNTLSFSLKNSYLKPTSMAFNSSGSQLIIGGADGHLKQLNIGPSTLLDRFELDKINKEEASEPFRAHEATILAIATTEVGPMIATGDIEGGIKLWRDSSNQNQELQSAGATSSDLLLTSPAGTSLFAIGHENIRHWIYRDAWTPGTLDNHPIAGKAESAAVSQDGSTIVIGLIDGRIQYCSTNQGENSRSEIIHAFPDAVTALSIDESANRLFAVSESGLSNQWPLPLNNDPQITVDESIPWLIQDKANQLLAVPSGRNNLDLYSQVTGQANRRHTIPSGDLVSAEFTSDGQVIGLVNQQGQIYFQTADRRTFAYANLPSRDKYSIQRLTARQSDFAVWSDRGNLGVISFPSMPQVVSTVEVLDAAYSQAADAIAILSQEYVHVLDSVTGAPRKSVDLKGNMGTGICLNGDSVFVGTGFGEIYLVPQNQNAELIKLSKTPSAEPIRAMTLTNEEIPAVLFADRSGNLYSTPSKPEAASETSKSNVAFSSNPSQIIASSDSLVAIYNDHLEIARLSNANAGEQTITIRTPKALSTSTQLTAVDKHIRYLAELDNQGSLTLRNFDSDDSSKITLPFKDITLMRWCDSGDSLIVSNGNRTAVISRISESVTAEYISPEIVKRIISCSESKLWFVDDQNQLRSLVFPRVNWSITDESDAAFSVASTSKTIGWLNSSNVLHFINPDTGKTTGKLNLDGDNPRGLIQLDGKDLLACITSTADIQLIDGMGTVSEISSVSEKSIDHLKHLTAYDALVAVDLDGQLISVEIKDENMVFDLASLSNQTLAGQTTDGDLIILEDEAKGIKFIETDVLWSLKTNPRLTPSTQATISPDGKFLYQIDIFGALYQTGLSPTASTKTILDNGVTDFAAIPAKVAAIQSSAEGLDASELVVIDSRTGQVSGNTQLSQEATKVCISKSGDQVAAALKDGSIAVFDATTLSPVTTLQLSSEVSSFEFNPQGSSLFVCTSDGEIRLHPLRSNGSITTEESGIVGLEFIQKSNDLWILACSRNGKIRIWNTKDLANPLCSLAGIEGPIEHCCIDESGENLIVTYEDAYRSTCIWPISQILPSESPIEPLSTIASKALVKSAAISRDGQILFAGLDKGGVSALRIADGKQMASISGHRLSVEKLEITDENILISYGKDNQIMALDLTGTPLESEGGVRREAMKMVMNTSEIQRIPNVDQTDEPTQILARQAINENRPPAQSIELITGDVATIKQAASITSELMKLLAAPDGDPTMISELRRQLAPFKQEVRQASRTGQNRISPPTSFTNQIFESETDYAFEPDDLDRSVAVQFDENKLYASRSSLKDRRPASNHSVQQLNGFGRLQAWDYAYTGLELRDWRLEELEVQNIVPMDNRLGAITVPTTTEFHLNGIASNQGVSTAWACNPTKTQLAKGLASGFRLENEVLQIYDLSVNSPLRGTKPVWSYKAYDEVVTAIAFANQSDHIAFAVRGPKTHRIVIADPKRNSLYQVEEFEHDTEWIQSPENTAIARTFAEITSNTRPSPQSVARRSTSSRAATLGVDQLVFSSDDKVLLSHGQYGKDGYKLNRWNVIWEDDAKIKETRKSIKELVDAKSPVIDTSRGRGIWFIENPRSTRETSGEVAASIHRGTQYRILAMTPNDFSVINMNSAKAEESIEFPTSRQTTPVHDVSDDGHWLMLGDASGRAYVWDLLKRRKFSVTIDRETERALAAEGDMIEQSTDRPAHTGPIAGVALSDPDPGRDYPAFAATLGEENRIKVWELYPILDEERGVRSKRPTRYPVSQR